MLCVVVQYVFLDVGAYFIIRSLAIIQGCAQEEGGCICGDLLRHLCFFYVIDVVDTHLHVLFGPWKLWKM